MAGGCEMWNSMRGAGGGGRVPVGRAVSDSASWVLVDDADAAAGVLPDGAGAAAAEADAAGAGGRAVRGSRARGKARIRNCAFGCGLITADRTMGDIRMIASIDEVSVRSEGVTELVCSLLSGIVRANNKKQHQGGSKDFIPVIVHLHTVSVPGFHCRPLNASLYKKMGRAEPTSTKSGVVITP